MPQTALRHFEEDIARADDLVGLGDPMAENNAAAILLRDDVLRSGWMFAIGALDAYFCDAYISLLTRTMRAKTMQSSVRLPDTVKKTALPIGAMLQSYSRPNWRWRMAVRQMMDKDNVLSVTRVRELFNPFARPGHKLYHDVIDSWVAYTNSTARVFGQTGAVYAGTVGAARDTARKAVVKHFQRRFKDIIQRRHDCIHNCDRPKVSPKPIGRAGTVRNVIRDVRFLVKRCDEHFESEFPQFLASIGCDATTRNALRV